MRIDNSQITMRSDYHYEKSETEQSHFEFWTNEPPRDRLEISDDGQLLAGQVQETEAVKEEENILKLSDEDKAKIKLLESLISAISGKSFKFKFAFLDGKTKKSNGNGKKKGHEQAQQRVGWGARYSYHRTYSEKEKVSFSSSGSVKTEDGREIDFKVNFKMSREVSESESFQMAMGDALIDPLVINYKGQELNLSEDRYEFDLELGNDMIENIAMPEKGSAFLALDLNKNGIIDDGSELFGPTTNDGFAELAAYDHDNNGWIDENDPIFSELLLWEKDENGEDQLIGLLKGDVGAIYLHSQSTPYQLNAGQLRESGIYLKESGDVGIIHEVDMFV